MKQLLLIAGMMFFGATPGMSQGVPGSIAEYSFDIGPRVTKGQLSPFFETIERSDRYFAALGVRMTPKDKKKWLFKIVATGKGFDGRVPPGRDPGCCSSTSHTHKIGPRPFFDVAHKEWRRARAEETIAHEYAHGIQFYFKANTYKGGPMGDWMEEGMAEYYGQDIVLGGNPSKMRQTLTQWFNGTRRQDIINYSLKELEPDGGHPHPGGIGFLAVAGLVEVSEYGRQAPLIYMQKLRKQGRKKAFEESFGISLSDFYARFEVWRKAVREGKTREPLWNRL